MLICFVLGIFILSVAAYIIVYNKTKVSDEQKIGQEIVDSIAKDSAIKDKE